MVPNNTKNMIEDIQNQLSRLDLNKKEKEELVIKMIVKKMGNQGNKDDLNNIAETIINMIN